MRGVLCLEDGFAIEGELWNHRGDAVGEVVFSTSMTGYEDALTDPSYCGQILVFSFPMIGNYGFPPGSGQSEKVAVRGLVVRDLWDADASHSLLKSLEPSTCPILFGADTRALVLHLRERGSKRGVIARTSEAGPTAQELVELRRRAAQFTMAQVVQEVSCKSASFLGDPSAPLGTLALVDFGCKSGIVTMLLERGFRVCRVPPDAKADEILSLEPSCVLLSNGPGDPEDNVQAIATAERLLERGEVPLFGVCLGHQILAKAASARITKLKYGHHGSNHPVKDIGCGRILVTSQNHNYAVDQAALPSSVSVTHLNLNDGTVEGIAISGSGKTLAESVQFHPEGGPGPANPFFWDRVIKAARRDGLGGVANA